MEPDHRCALCHILAKFYCECDSSITFLCSGCITQHLQQLQSRIHQVQSVDWMDKSPLDKSPLEQEPPELMKLLCERQALRLVYALNAGNFEDAESQQRQETQKRDRNVVMVGRQTDTRNYPPGVCNMDLLTRDLRVDDLFMLSHSHNLRHVPKPKNKCELFTYQPGSGNLCAFDPLQGTIMWNHSARIIPSGAALCALNNGVLIFTGGYSNNTWLSQSFSIKTASMGVTELTPMLTERECHGVLEYKDFIYVFGGVNSSGILNQCERYNLSSKSWQTLPSLEKHISKVTPVLLNHRIYLAGYNSTAVLEFNPATLKSRVMFSGMLDLAEAVCAFTCGEHLFLLQGAFLVCADVGSGGTSQPARRKADHRHWYCPTSQVASNGVVYFCRWYEEVWEFGLEQCTLRQLLNLDFSQVE